MRSPWDWDPDTKIMVMFGVMATACFVYGYYNPKDVLWDSGPLKWGQIDPMLIMGVGLIVICIIYLVQIYELRRKSRTLTSTSLTIHVRENRPTEGTTEEKYPISLTNDPTSTKTVEVYPPFTWLPIGNVSKPRSEIRLDCFDYVVCPTPLLRVYGTLTICLGHLHTRRHDEIGKLPPKVRRELLAEHPEIIDKKATIYYAQRLDSWVARLAERDTAERDVLLAAAKDAEAEFRAAPTTESWKAAIDAYVQVHDWEVKNPEYVIDVGSTSTAEDSSEEVLCQAVYQSERDMETAREMIDIAKARIREMAGRESDG